MNTASLCRRLYVLGLHLIIVVVMLGGQLARAESKIPAEAIKGMADQMVLQMSNASCLIIGIVSGQDEAFIGLGETARGNGVTPTRDTVWAIGSVSKVITSQILGAMVVSGEVKLTDPLSMYLPKDAKLPSMDGREITLLDLATHSAGFPRSIITEEEYDKTGDLANPAYDKKRALQWLATNKLDYMPGTEQHYSNFGFGWLGQALAAKRGVTYEQLVEDYYGAFGMKQTTVAPTPEQLKRKAASYWMDGREIDPDWVFNFEQPSGGVYSTGTDMLTFLKLCLGQLKPPTPQANSIAQATYLYQSQFENRQTISDSGMALGWSVVDAHNELPVLLHKNGWVSGFNTWVIILPGENIGIFSMTNQPFLHMKDPLESILRIVLAARDGK